MESTLSRYGCCNPFLDVVSLDGLMAAGRSGSSESSNCEGASIIDFEGPSLSAESLLARSQLASQADEFLATLPPRERAVVSRVFWGGETRASVARSLGVSASMIAKILKRALNKGRVILEPQRDIFCDNAQYGLDLLDG